MTEEKEPSLREAVASELASQVEDLFKDTLNWGCTNIAKEREIRIGNT